jgi:hypothetical protein
MIKVTGIIENLSKVEVAVNPKCNYSNGKVDGTLITIEVNKIAIYGEITLRERQGMEVSITSPYVGVYHRTGYV